MKTLITILLALAGGASASAQYAYEPSPKGTIPSDSIPYSALPDTASLTLAPLPEGERLPRPQRWGVYRQYNHSLPPEE
ncbi:MAG: hypothetical protein K2M14_06930, partial [Muribaculaceae bacterium]|nr:hypothetical protein [Muribaculaceae bacterium]